MALRIFTLTNPKQPVIAVCEICNTEVKARRHSNAAGEQWINGEELVQSWLDHQLIDCIPREVNDEDSVLG